MKLKIYEIDTWNWNSELWVREVCQGASACGVCEQLVAPRKWTYCLWQMRVNTLTLWCHLMKRMRSFKALASRQNCFCRWIGGRGRWGGKRGSIKREDLVSHLKRWHTSIPWRSWGARRPRQSPQKVTHAYPMTELRSAKTSSVTPKGDTRLYHDGAAKRNVPEVEVPKGWNWSLILIMQIQIKFFIICELASWCFEPSQPQRTYQGWSSIDICLSTVKVTSTNSNT